MGCYIRCSIDSAHYSPMFGELVSHQNLSNGLYRNARPRPGTGRQYETVL